MKKYTPIQILFTVFLISQFSYAQVVSIYNNLVWSDEFDTPGPVAIDGMKWHHQTQIPAGGSWYNNEVQHYTNRQVNSYQNSGTLNLVAKKHLPIKVKQNNIHLLD